MNPCDLGGGPIGNPRCRLAPLASGVADMRDQDLGQQTRATLSGATIRHPSVDCRREAPWVGSAEAHRIGSVGRP